MNRRRIEAEMERVEVARLREEHEGSLGDEDQGAEVAEPVEDPEGGAGGGRLGPRFTC